MEINFFVKNVIFFVFNQKSARIDYQLNEARHQVSELDRAPRANSESWHQLRQNLALAQTVLSRFERANRNYEKFQTHILFRLSTVLLELRRKQLIFIWNRINSDPVMVTAISAKDEKIQIEPNPDKWREIMKIHLSDLVPIIALALERSLEKSQENESSERHHRALASFEKIIPFLISDHHSDKLIRDITEKVDRDLRSIQEFAENKLNSHHEVAKYIHLFDVETTVDEIFSPDGVRYLENMIENFKRWKEALDGKLEVFGSCSLSTSSFSTRTLERLTAAAKMTQSASEFRLNEKINWSDGEISDIKTELDNIKNCEKLAVLAKNITTVTERHASVKNLIAQMIQIIKLLPQLEENFKVFFVSIFTYTGARQ